MDVRVIAATHRNIAQMVVDGKFRADLYYRLHVFPVTLSPLRDGREDVPVLVRHYANPYAGRMNRRIKVIPSPMTDALDDIPGRAMSGNAELYRGCTNRVAGKCAPLSELTESIMGFPAGGCAAAGSKAAIPTPTITAAVSSSR